MCWIETWKKCWRALMAQVVSQTEHHTDADPAVHFIQLLASILSSGQGHVATKLGASPGTSPELWGWRIGEGKPRPLGKRLGWIMGEDLYLDQETSYAEVQRFANSQGEALPVNAKTLAKRLKERKLLAHDWKYDPEKARLLVKS